LAPRLNDENMLTADSGPQSIENEKRLHDEVIELRCSFRLSFQDGLRKSFIAQPDDPLSEMESNGMSAPRSVAPLNDRI
jgi:hypothetical protein